jgi:hypothetical protein
MIASATLRYWSANWANSGVQQVAADGGLAGVDAAPGRGPDHPPDGGLVQAVEEQAGVAARQAVEDRLHQVLVVVGRAHGGSPCGVEPHDPAMEIIHPIDADDDLYSPDEPCPARPEPPGGPGRLAGRGQRRRAAQRLNLSQPAVSHALRRLREATGDPLLVRVGPRMELTPRAQALRAPLAQALDQVRGLFQAQGFDPATSTPRLPLMMPDLCVDLLMPAVLAQVTAPRPACGWTSCPGAARPC